MSNALWDEVLKRPDDDEPRLVLADWLQQHGDPRGELIALQCQLAAVPEDERGLAELDLVARCKKLISEHGLSWLEGWPVDAIPDFERGFPHHLAAPSYQVAQHAAHLFTAAPTLNAVTLNDEDPRLWRSGFAAFLVARGIERLRKLSLPIVNGTADVAALASARALSKLEALTFRGGMLGRQGISALVQSTFRGALRVLSFEFDAGWGDRWPQELGAFDLTAFRSGANRVGDVAAAFPHLRTLVLGLTPLVNAGGLEALHELTTLELHDVELSRKGMSALGQGFPNVRRFAMSKQPKAIGIVNERWPKLESLDLHATVLGDDGVVQLVSRPWAAQLKALDVAQNGLTDASAKRLAEAELPALRRVDVSSNAISPDGLQRLERRGWLVIS
jgi:uncharacterized protein (TIGR02996 family)